MAVKVTVEFDGNVYEIDLDSKDFVIGRSSAADLKVKDPKCSGRHASLRLENGRALIKDLSSSNGTYVQNSLINEAFLYVNQIVRIGHTIIKLKEDDMSPEELMAHTRDGGRRKNNSPIDIEIGLKEKGRMANEILKKTKRDQFIVNQNYMKDGKSDNKPKFEVEKTTHVKKMERMEKKRLTREALRKKHEERKKQQTFGEKVKSWLMDTFGINLDKDR